MTTPPPDKPVDFTASDILSADVWTGRTPSPWSESMSSAPRSRSTSRTCAASPSSECMRRNLELLRDATVSDCAFLAALIGEDLTFADGAGRAQRAWPSAGPRP